MNSLFITEIEVRDDQYKFHSATGRYMAILGTNELVVFDFGSQPGNISRYEYKHIVEFGQGITNIAFFEDYIVLVIRSAPFIEQQGYLELLRFNFRIGSIQQLELPFPKIDWTDRRPKLNSYPALPMKVAKHFHTDFVYFQDDRLNELLDTDKIVIEFYCGFYQITDVSHDAKVLLKYQKQRPSPFTMTCELEQIAMANYRIIKYNKLRVKQSFLIILNKIADIWKFCDSVCLIHCQMNRILMKSKTKTVRNVRFTSTIHISDLQSPYSLITLKKQTLRVNMITARSDILSSTGEDILLRGKYMFNRKYSSIDQHLRRIVVTKLS